MAYFDTKEGSLEEAVKAAVKSEKLDAVNPKAVKKKFDDRKDKDIDNDGDTDSTDKYLHKRRKAISKAMKSEKDKKEAFEYGTPEATENSLKVTPGQSTDDWNKQVGVMQEKQSSMRETLAKMWGVEEGHNPFDEKITRGTGKKGLEKSLDKLYGPKRKPKKEEKDSNKTMTGKPMTKVSVNSEKKDT